MGTETKMSDSVTKTRKLPVSLEIIADEWKRDFILVRRQLMK
jgi:hypothetical protein